MHLAASLLPLIVIACTPKEDSSAETTEDSGPPAERQVPSPTFVDAATRLVAFGDVHGDLDVTREVLRMAGAIDESDSWIGGELVVVQTGDQIDRGPDDREILDLFEDLADQAHAAGGAVYSLVGNHGIMNVELDLRYVHTDAWAAFDDIEYDPDDAELADYEEDKRGRVAAFRPGGPYAMVLAGRNVAMTVGDTAFVHGGILPEPAEYGIDLVNAEVQAWMQGDGQEPDEVQSSYGLVWSRHYSDEPDDLDCGKLESALEKLDALRMVVGHTVQDEPNPACDGKVWRIDTGMSDYYGGEPFAIEIVGDEVSVID